MARRNGIDWAGLYESVFKLASQATAVQCVWSHQKHAPEPRRPYCLIGRPSSLVAVDSDWTQKTADTATNENSIDILGVRELRIQFDVFADAGMPPDDAMSIAEAAQTFMLNDKSVLADADLAVIETSPVIDNSIIEGAHWVSRATFDIRLRLPTIIEGARRVATINNVHATITGRDGVDGLPVTKSVTTEG